MKEVKFTPVEGYGELASNFGDGSAGNIALLISHGPLYEGTGLTPPQVAVWYDDGEKSVCADMEEARVAVRARQALEAK